MTHDYTQTIDRLRKNGWAPVPWSHHPDDIKDLIREAGFRPAAKACYTNCGKLVLAARLSQYEPDVVYCEGTFHRDETIAVPHAWLRYCGRIVDLTIVDGTAEQYEQRLELTPAEVAERCHETGRFGPFAGPDPNVEALARYNAILARNLGLA